MALLISIGNLGGAIGSNIFLAEQKPHYWLGYGMGLGMTLAAIIATMILRKAYIAANKKRDLLSEEEIRAKYTQAEMLGEKTLLCWSQANQGADMGDKSPLYRYVV